MTWLPENVGIDPSILEDPNALQGEGRSIAVKFGKALIKRKSSVVVARLTDRLSDYYSQKYDTVYLSLALSFDAFVFIATLITTFAAARQYRAKPWLRVIQRDGIIYFMAIFSSTLIWLLLGQVARVSVSRRTPSRPSDQISSQNGLKLINAMYDHSPAIILVLL
ncbi:hypothetical protein H0H87_009308 [Tephrocybe sp. NHM501043]|nr:hypothetical protein H0H87_009308 [Tephrocybe sp. NHM501043]